MECTEGDTPGVLLFTVIAVTECRIGWHSRKKSSVVLSDGSVQCGCCQSSDEYSHCAKFIAILYSCLQACCTNLPYPFFLQWIRQCISYTSLLFIKTFTSLVMFIFTEYFINVHNFFFFFLLLRSHTVIYSCCSYIVCVANFDLPIMSSNLCMFFVLCGAVHCLVCVHIMTYLTCQFVHSALLIFTCVLFFHGCIDFNCITDSVCYS